MIISFDLNNLSKEELISFITQHSNFVRCAENFNKFKEGLYYKIEETDWDDIVLVSGVEITVDQLHKYFETEEHCESEEYQNKIIEKCRSIIIVGDCFYLRKSNKKRALQWYQHLGFGLKFEDIYLDTGEDADLCLVIVEDIKAQKEKT